MNDKDTEIYRDILERYPLVAMTARYRTHGWDEVWRAFRIFCREAAFADERERVIATDLFFSLCLDKITPADGEGLVWELAAEWCGHRHPPWLAGGLPAAEQAALTLFCAKLRDKIHQYMETDPASPFADLPASRGPLFITIWRQLFLNSFSPLQLYLDPPPLVGDFQSSTPAALLRGSLRQPFAAHRFAVDIGTIWDGALPAWVKIVLTLWLINTPYYNATPDHRAKLLRHSSDLCRILAGRDLDQGLYVLFVEELANQFWRASYVAGDNSQGLNAFGDFIAARMAGYYPELAAPVMRCGDGKIRIGYLSANFAGHAISHYMLNRVIHHDRDKFAVHTFVLGERHDSFTDIFAANSVLQRFPTADIRAVADAVLASRLDILIYADIGLDAATYMLAGLRLAPVQCAMVGHGTTTGLPTIDYYISGDFEPADADSHYREQLIRLPGAGAAQYPPVAPDRRLTRAQLGIAKDAVVLISCANGMKHSPDRDRLLVEIVRQAPKAIIVLKPFPAPAMIDHHLTRRLTTAAKEGGVEGRLVILPPVKDPQAVQALLSIADIQLDTYPYGGWTTNLDALHAGLPIVTQEGAMARSRWGAGLLRTIGVSEGIAAGPEEYVAWAVRLAGDEWLRRRTARLIREKAAALFDGAAAQPSYEHALTEIYRRHAALRPRGERS